ncbi:MAG: hypothetical protein IPK81_13900 [Rhodospirillales bacterium]|nr:MAG: hypothetical protein IPK81_13900 [Rhodospirillales bacterium]
MAQKASDLRRDPRVARARRKHAFLKTAKVSPAVSASARLPDMSTEQRAEIVAAYDVMGLAETLRLRAMKRASLHGAVNHVSMCLRGAQPNPEMIWRDTPVQKAASSQAPSQLLEILADGALTAEGVLHSIENGVVTQRLVTIGREWWKLAITTEDRGKVVAASGRPFNVVDMHWGEMVRLVEPSRGTSGVPTRLTDEDLAEDSRFSISGMQVAAAISDIDVDRAALDQIFPLTRKQAATLRAEAAELDRGGPTPNFDLRIKIQGIARDVLKAKRGDLAGILKEIADRHVGNGGSALNPKDVERLLWPDLQGDRESDARWKRRNGASAGVTPQTPADRSKRR